MRATGGDEFGANRPGTAGTDRDLERSGESKNQGHGHPREERDESSALRPKTLGRNGHRASSAPFFLR